MVVYKSKLTYDGSIMVALNFWLHRFGLMDALSDDGLRKRFYRNWTKDGPFAIIANNIINIWLQISNHFITLAPNLINIYHPLNGRWQEAEGATQINGKKKPFKGHWYVKRHFLLLFKQYKSSKHCQWCRELLDCLQENLGKGTEMQTKLNKKCGKKLRLVNL